MDRSFRFRAGLLMVAAVLFFSVPSFACTSVIVSGKMRADGRPVMFKHRDTGQLNNKMEWFQGEKYAFVALVNSNWNTEPTTKVPFHGAEAWSGTNSAGFCIMNTATYDLKDDDVPEKLMDREGQVMYRALEICRNLADFETLLDTLSRPMGVETNFGVIDAEGGAAYYEVNNHSWVKFDVNKDPEGYRVVTNFTRTGRVEDRRGVDRFEKTGLFMESAIDGWSECIPHKKLINGISRSGKPILRNITSAVAVFEGVKPGDDPLKTVMWTALGWPATAVYVPLMVLHEDHIPSYLKGYETAVMCDNALSMKDNDYSVECAKEETFIDPSFDVIYQDFASGKLSEKRFSKKYDRLMGKYFKVYNRIFADLLKID